MIAKIIYIYTKFQGQIQDFYKGVYMYKGVCVCVCVCVDDGGRFADFISFFLNIP